jgi:hypothetical protein
MWVTGGGTPLANFGVLLGMWLDIYIRAGRGMYVNLYTVCCLSSFHIVHFYSLSPVGLQHVFFQCYFLQCGFLTNDTLVTLRVTFSSLCLCILLVGRCHD